MSAVVPWQAGAAGSFSAGGDWYSEMALADAGLAFLPDEDDQTYMEGEPLGPQSPRCDPGQRVVYKLPPMRSPFDRRSRGQASVVGMHVRFLENSCEQLAEYWSSLRGLLEEADGDADPAGLARDPGRPPAVRRLAQLILCKDLEIASLASTIESLEEVAPEPAWSSAVHLVDRPSAVLSAPFLVLSSDGAVCAGGDELCMRHSRLTEADRELNVLLAAGPGGLSPVVWSPARGARPEIRYHELLDQPEDADRRTLRLEVDHPGPNTSVVASASGAPEATAEVRLPSGARVPLPDQSGVLQEQALVQRDEVVRQFHYRFPLATPGSLAPITLAPEPAQRVRELAALLESLVA